jgi:Ca-activated chloride channel family protein
MSSRWILWGGMLLALVAVSCAGAPPPSVAPPATPASAARTSAPPAAKPPASAPAEAEAEPVGLVLVVDRSGSMSGEKFEQAKKACISAIAALKKDDRVAVVIFDSEARILVELGEASRPELAATVSKMQPGGGTHIKPALEAAAALIPDGNLRFRIVLMSDGQAPRDGLDEVVGALRHRGISLSSVALGEEADRELLRNLAEKGGGTFHDVSLPAELETVFVREANDRTRPRAP